MASKIEAADLTVTISEIITLNNVDEGSSNSFTLSSINEITQRIINITTSAHELISFGASNARGSYLFSGVQYLRITNLDDTAYAKLRFTGESSTDFTVRLDAGCSYIIAENHATVTGVDDYCDINGVALEKLSNISGLAATGTVNLELFVACI